MDDEPDTTRSKRGSIAWDLLAPIYDWQARLEQPALRAAVDLADISGADRVLDAGCGTGQWLRLVERASEPARLVGVDRSRSMLERAERTDAQLVRADLAALPFAEGDFDVVCTAYVLHLLDEQALAIVLAELRRVLAGGGRLVTVTPWTSSGPWCTIGQALAARLEGTRWHAMGGLRPLDPRPQLERAGFRVDAAVEVDRGYRSLCVRGIAS